MKLQRAVLYEKLLAWLRSSFGRDGRQRWEVIDHERSFLYLMSELGGAEHLPKRKRFAAWWRRAAETRTGSQQGVVAWIEQRSSFSSSQQIYAAMFRRRTESGRPASSMRLRIATLTAASACCPEKL